MNLQTAYELDLASGFRVTYESLVKQVTAMADALASMGSGAAKVVLEVEAVATKMGIEMPISVGQRIAGAEQVGEHKTSMLQDLEAGRPMEWEAMVGAVVELGERLDVPIRYTRTVYACTRLLSSHALSVGGSK